MLKRLIKKVSGVVRQRALKKAAKTVKKVIQVVPQSKVLNATDYNLKSILLSIAFDILEKAGVETLEFLKYFNEGLQAEKEKDGFQVEDLKRAFDFAVKKYKMINFGAEN